MQDHACPRFVSLVLVGVGASAGCQDCGNATLSDGHLADAGHDASTHTDGGSYGTLCYGGKYSCEGDIAVNCDNGVDRQDCAKKGLHCDELLGCAECRPGAATCADGAATFCRDDGTLATFDCDSTQGMRCTATGCEGACSLGEVHDSYIGCDYYPTITLNPVWSGFAFAVAVANTSGDLTHVTVTRGSTTVAETTVASGELKTLELPWVPELKGGDVSCAIPPPAGDTRLARGGAYRLRTDQPVTVYQFSALEYQLDPVPEGCPVLSQCAPPEAMNTETRCLSYSNDASLLLPATALTGNYTAMAFASQENGAGFVAITALENGTRVDVRGHGAFMPGGGIDAKGQGVVTLNRGDVLELVAKVGSDPSGTRIRADKAVQVIAGHSCAYVPSEDVANCDHIEEALFPEDTLGLDYIVTYPVYADLSSPTPLLMRVSAIETDTQVSFDPPVHAPATLAPGDVLEVSLGRDEAKNVRVTATKPIIVASYMVGQAQLSASGIVGDPALTLAVPIAQYRADYLFTAPATYLVNVANVVAPKGAAVRIDGRPIPAAAFEAVGTSDYAVAHVELTGPSSVHTITSDKEVGLTVYGYGLFTSYMYPGGADLDRITVPPIL